MKQKKIYRDRNGTDQLALRPELRLAGINSTHILTEVPEAGSGLVVLADPDEFSEEEVEAIVAELQN